MTRLACLLGAVLAACGGNGPESAPVAAIDGGATDASAPATDGPPPLGPAPPFSIEEEAESPCATTTSAPARVVTTGGVVLEDLAVAGDRLVARSATGDAMVLFDRDGANATAPITLGEDAHVVGGPNGVSAAFIEAASAMLVAGRFDPFGVPSGGAQPIGPVRAGRTFALARTTRAVDSTLLAWVAPPSVLQARIVDDADRAGAPIRLEDGTPPTDFDDLSVVAATSPSTTDASEYLVVWSLRRIALASYRVYAALVGRDGIVGLTRAVFSSDARITLAKLVTRDGAATLLANRDGEPLVVPLDALGRASGPARLFKGARDNNLGGGHDLAWGNDRLAVVVEHASGSHALRVVGADAKPVTGWSCLDAPRPDAFHLGTVIADGAGWKVLVATVDGSAMLDVDLSGASAR